MKKMLNCLLLAFLFTSFSPTISAQNNAEPTHYYIVEYMKVKPGMNADYLKMEAAWKKIHQANIKAGKYTFWTLSEIVSHRGSNAEYDYITRTNFVGEKQLANHMENFSYPDNLSSLLTYEEMEIVNRTSDIRDYVKSEVWRNDDQVMAQDLSKSKVSVFNYFNFPEGGSRAAHLKVERDYWKPVHKIRVDSGEMLGWVLLSKMMPGNGSHEPYFDATVDIYGSMMDYLTSGSPVPALEKAHPGKKLEDIFDETSKAADLIRAEVRVSIMNSNN